MDARELSAYECPSCHGTGLAGPTYEDVWNACEQCDGAGETFEDDNE